MDKQDRGMVLREATFQVAGRLVIAPLNLEFPAHGVTGLVGKNGSGKSTLLKMLARQQSPTSGSITFRDIELDRWNQREFAQCVAYMPQQMPLAGNLRVRELVELGRYPWHGALGRFGARDHEKVSEALSLTSTESLADRFVDSLSGGERQRVWIAMLLAQDAKILLLDEPTAALDVAYQIAVLELIQRLSLERRIAIVIVIHEISMALRFCDRLVALKDGHLLAQGASAEVATPDRLENIFEVPMGIFTNPSTSHPTIYVRR